MCRNDVTTMHCMSTPLLPPPISAATKLHFMFGYPPGAPQSGRPAVCSAATCLFSNPPSPAVCAATTFLLTSLFASPSSPFKGTFPTLNLAEDGFPYTSPVDAFPPQNSLGLRDAVGNAWEWVEDWWTPDRSKYKQVRPAGWDRDLVELTPTHPTRVFFLRNEIEI